MAEGADSVWRTLDARWLYLYGSTAGYLYEAQLRHELTVRLGVEWGPVRNGIADLQGIDEAVRGHFSDRSKEIQEHLDGVGFRTAAPPNWPPLPPAPEGHDGAGGVDASGVGGQGRRDRLGPRQPRGRRGPSTAPGGRGRCRRSRRGVLSAEGLTRQASSFDRRDLLRGLCERLPAGAIVAEIEAMADQVLARTEVVRLVQTDGADCWPRT